MTAPRPLSTPLQPSTYPVPLADSRLTAYDWDRAFAEQFDDYMRLDIRAAFKMDGKFATQEWAIDIQNITNRKNPLYQRYNPIEGEINTVYQLGFFLVPQYRIIF